MAFAHHVHVRNAGIQIFAADHFKAQSLVEGGGMHLGAEHLAAQVLRLLDYVIFNALIGNHDAHAKNLSLLYSGKAPVLAPFYDTLSTAVYPALTPKMAMKIGSKYKFGEVQARHWEQFAEGAGLAKAQARQRILELAKSLPSIARKLQSDPDHGYVGNAVVERINALIEQRCALTIRQIAEPSA